MIGTAIYTWAGTGATASLFLATVGNKPAFGNLLTIGLAYGMGIAFAIIVAAPVSGGHFNAAFTLAFALTGRFPWKKVPHYILSQLFGAFISCLIVYSQYREQLNNAKTTFLALGGNAALFSSSGPAGVLAVFPSIGQNLTQVFKNELVATIFLSLVVFSIIDHAHNPFVSYHTAPISIGLAYAVCIWSFAIETVALNPSRDLGGRMAAAAVFGKQAFTQSPKYTAIGSLAPILGTIIGAYLHKIFIADDTRSLVPSLEGARSSIEVEADREREEALKA